MQSISNFLAFKILVNMENLYNSLAMLRKIIGLIKTPSFSSLSNTVSELSANLKNNNIKYKIQLALHKSIEDDGLTRITSENVSINKNGEPRIDFQGKHIKRVLVNSDEISTKNQWTQLLLGYLYYLVFGPYEQLIINKDNNSSVPMKHYLIESLCPQMNFFASYVQEITVESILFFQKCFRYKYPFSKYDQVFAHEYKWGVMANSAIFLLLFRSKKNNIIKLIERSKEFSKAEEYTLEEYIDFSTSNVKYFDIPIPYFVEQDSFMICRKKNWNKFSELKTFLCLPGSAFVYHDLTNYEEAYSVLLDCLPEDYQIIVVLYPVAPECKFPGAIFSIQQSIKCLIQNYAKYLVIPSKTILGGYSSGGSMVPSIAIEFAKKGIMFHATLMISTVFDYSGTLRLNNELTQKWQKYEKKDHPLMNEGFIQFINRHYSNSKRSLFHQWYSPIFTPHEDLKYLTNPHFIYGEYDFMRSTIEQFRHLLAKIGIKQESKVLLGFNHNVLVLVSSSPQISEQKKNKKLNGVKEIANFIHKILM